jgi:hypothetical protein
MKQKIFRMSAVFISLLMVFSLVPAQTASAGTSNIYLTPASGTYTTGNSFTVQVKGSSDTVYFQTGTVSGAISFPANRLQVTGISTSGSSYANMSATPNNTNGTISFSGSATPGPSGNLHFFAITFRAIAPGTAVTAFSANTTVNYSAPFVTSTSKAGGTYTINNPPTCPAGQTGTPPNCVTPPTTCPAGQTGTPPNCVTPPKPNPPTTPTTPSTPAPEPVVVAPITEEKATETPTADGEEGTSENVIFDNVRITRRYTSVEITWTHKIESTTAVNFGTSRSSMTSSAEVTKEADGSFKAILKDLKPGVQYFFELNGSSVTATDKKETYGGVFVTRGYPVVLSVTEGTKPAAGAKIELSGSNYTTDKSGRVILELAEGTFNAKIATKSSSKNVSFSVAKKSIPSDDKAPDGQEFKFDLAASADNEAASTFPLLPVIGGGLGILLLIGGVLLFLFYKKRRDADNQPIVDSTTTASSDAYWTQNQSQQYPTMNTDSTQPIEQQSPDFVPENEAGYATQPIDQPTAEDAYPMDPLAYQPETPTEPLQPVAVESLPLPEPTSEYVDPIAATESPEAEVPSEEPNQLLTQATAPEDPNEPLLAQIEQTPVDDGPDAIYDASTGELDIVHHDTEQPAVAIEPSFESPAPSELTPNQVASPPLEEQLPVEQVPANLQTTDLYSAPEQNAAAPDEPQQKIVGA